MNSVQDTTFRELLEVSANGFGGHAQVRGKQANCDTTTRSSSHEDLALPFICLHRPPPSAATGSRCGVRHKWQSSADIDCTGSPFARFSCPNRARLCSNLSDSVPGRAMSLPEPPTTMPVQAVDVARLGAPGRRAAPSGAMRAAFAFSTPQRSRDVQTQTLLSSGSARTTNDGASLSSTTRPPAATAAAMRSTATSGATQRSI